MQTLEFRARPEPPGAQSIRFSILAAAHDIAPYLGEFIGSVEAQTFPLDRVEVIAVDDGSTDETLSMLHAWQSSRPDLVTVLTQANRGAPAARNLALERARGEWVTFTDPDDLLDPDYLSAVDTFLNENPQVPMVVGNRSTYDEYTGEILRHPMARAVPAVARLVDLRRAPESFADSASCAFFRSATLRERKLDFDPRVRPNFDGGLFCARYLLSEDDPLIGYVPAAHYLHRARADGLRSQQAALRDPERFRTVPRVGLLRLLHESSAPGGYPPEWVQNLVLCELARYFRPEQVSAGAATAVRGELADCFVEALRQIVRLLDPGVVAGYRATRFDSPWRDVVLHGLTGPRGAGPAAWVSPSVVVTGRDPIRRQIQLAYRFTGSPPSEQVLLSGRPIEVEHGKVRTYEFFDHTLLYERLAWVPAHRSIRVVLDGHPRPIVPEWPEPVLTTVRPSQLQQWLTGTAGKDEADEPLSAGERAIVRLAASRPVRRRFARAWVLMDKTHEANDNAERLFDYLRRERPKTNAWFVLERDCPDWRRLATRAGLRLVAYGSLRWKLLMLNCTHLVSSQADRSVLCPDALTRLNPPAWKFSFIQHGVIKSDLSRWLNNQTLDLLVTSTEMEERSIAGDRTPYALTTKEVRLTGLPRFDRLRELGLRVDPSERDVILVCPTWRHWLTAPKQTGSNRRTVNADFLDSDYVRQWVGLLASPRLRELTHEHGLRIVFLPHPNVSAALDQLALPAHVEAVSYAGNDVQQLIARTVVMITDYSSVSFDAAYLDRPVVYFQFDADRVLDGGHNGRPGYYDHYTHGFGPVTDTVDSAVDAVQKIIAVDGGRPAPIYAHRIEQTFPVRDGRCCERTAAAIAELTRTPKRPHVSYRPVEQ